MHGPWVGKHYEQGIRRQRIAVVGYSHWHEGGGDSVQGTVETIQKVLKAEAEFDKIQFFVRIRDSFGFRDHREFWDRVLFFNFLPESIGGPEARFGRGTTDQTARGRERLWKILEKHRPHKLLVFTKKGWESCPPTREEEAGGVCSPLATGFPGFTRGTYALPGHIVMAFGLRHTQGAKTELMRQAVERILAMPVGSA